MYDWNTLENNATFASFNCENCRRYWHPEFRLMSRPVCLLNDYQPFQCGAKFGLQDPVLHLPMNDNRPSPKVYDTRQIFNQTFSDPTGNPNTSAHSVSGPSTLALSFDGVDDYIALTPTSHQSYLALNTDFTLALWWGNVSPPPAATKHFASNYLAATNGIALAVTPTYTSISLLLRWSGGSRAIVYASPGAPDSAWHHYAITREGLTIIYYIDGSLVKTDSNANNNLALFTSEQNFTLGCQWNLTKVAHGNMADFRIYDRALSITEIIALATP
jgi:hypothetical protein